MPTDYLHITGITENSWQPTMSCIKAENRTGCQNGPSAWIKLWMLKKWNDGRAGKEQTWKKAVVPKTPEEILQKSTTEVLHSNYSLSMSTSKDSFKTFSWQFEAKQEQQNSKFDGAAYKYPCQ